MIPKIVVIGTSAGGLSMLQHILADLPKDWSTPILIVQHQLQTADESLVELLNLVSPLPCCYALDGQKIQLGHVYVSPPGYHFLVEDSQTLALSDDEPIHYARPSIDLLLQSAATAFGKAVIAVILTGANSDGAAGLKKVKEQGGITLVQMPLCAEYDAMPNAAISATDIDCVCLPSQISLKLREYCHYES
ncbi:chemotaxis protein CheB [Saccharobesus litoralis]|uniref:protein-glutamate methylesterase n=1 Tax=Saccharobesus litoralis TaxID=2172099 RepID=A0A2S0VXL4_9ALTE|nr:chemotaxis protein CheB [Saccharobesus litoralis]